MKLKFRIALALAASFVLAGIVVLGISAVTYQNAVYRSPTEQTDALLRQLGSNRAEAIAYLREHPEAVFGADNQVASNGRSVNEAFQQAQRNVQQDAVDRARIWSIVALVAMASVAGLVGWLLAGRALRPIRTITARARAASATDLSARVSLGGPNDEIRELGDTFDDMLARLENAFVSQRRFAAQVSHELRTPLAIIATETELMLSDVAADRASLEQIRVATDRAERIIGALLVLSRSGSGDLAPMDLELDRVTGDVLGQVVQESGWRDVRVELDLASAPVRADPALLERLIVNLLANAVRHNRRGGWVDVRTRRDDDWALIEVANSTELVDGPDGREHQRGIGLTVVDAVIAAHGGTLTWIDEPDAVRIQVRLPVPSTVLTEEPVSAMTS
jgi:signal transduction histidine kinase